MVLHGRVILLTFALSKAVLMIDKSTNEILREFESAYGYIWRYKNKENCI